MALTVKIFGKDNLTGTLKGIGKRVGKLATDFTKFGVASSLAIGGISVKLSSDFSKSVREISTLMDGVTEGGIKNMQDELKNLAAASGVGLGSLVKARYDIVSAGFASAADSALVLKQSADLAIGGVTSAASAADILTTALNAYGLEASQVTDVSDILFTTVRLGKTTMDELSGSMGRVLPIANAAGLSLSDVGAAMATITASGLDTFEAATALRGAIKALSAPSNEAATAMENAGIEVQYFDDGAVNLLDTIKQFQGLSPEELTKFVPDIRASTAIIAMANNVDVLADNIEDMGERAGATETAVDKMSAEFAIKMAKLKNNMQNVMIAIGDVIIKEISFGVEQANEIMGTLGEIGWDNVSQGIQDNWGTLVEFLILSTEAAVNYIDIKLQQLVNNFKTGLPAILGGITEGVANKQNEILQIAAEAQLSTLTNLLQTSLAMINVWGKQADEIGETVGDASDEIGETVGDAADVTTDNQEVVKKSMIEIIKSNASAVQGFKDDMFSALSMLGTAFPQMAGMAKKAAQVQAVVDTYASANAAYKAMAGIPVIGPALAVAAASAAIASGLANVAIIEKQQLAFGGEVTRQTLGNTDIIPAMLTPGEIVSTQNASEVFGDEIIRMNQLAESGMSRGKGSEAPPMNNVTIMALDSRSFEDFARRNPRGFKNAITIATQRTRT